MAKAQHVEFDPSSKEHRWFLAHDLRVALLGLGFAPVARPGAKELVFGKASTRLGGVQMLVFTSIEGEGVRGLGADSIKVCTVFTAADGTTRGIGSERRVHRTGDINGISKRVVDRIKDAAADLNAAPVCDCGAPKFKSKKGNLICAAICWANK